MEGRYSIFNNVPSTLINVLENGDSYVLPSDFLRLYFALGILKPHLITCEGDIPGTGDGVHCA